MRIAVTYENGQIFQHFGHTKAFKIYDVEKGRIAMSMLVDTDENGHGALAGLLNRLGVEVLICGGIGSGAQRTLRQEGVKLYGGVTGSADDAVLALIENRLEFDPNIKCVHHGDNNYCKDHPHEKNGCAGNH